MRTARRGRALRRASSVIAAFSLALPVAVLASERPAGAASCTKVLVIGARGSGQESKAYDGMGETAYRAVESLRRSLARKTTASVVALDYPAQPVLDASFLLRPDLFATSAQAGIDELLSVLDARARRCPKQVVAFVGFSQGALVINRTLVEIERTRPQMLGRIASVTLVSDPQRNAAGSYVRGTANPSWYGLTIINRLFPNDDVPSALWSRTDSYCNAGDVVCAWDPATGVLSAALGVLTGNDPLRVHLGYATDGTANEAGRRAADRIEEHLRLTKAKL